MAKFKTRNYILLLYPEDSTHCDAFCKLTTNGYNYAYILHNKDVWSENDAAFNPDKHTLGEPKKEHWHFVVTFQNPIWSTSLASELGITDNYIMPAHDLNVALPYLIHFGYDDKAQYDIEDVQGPLVSKLQKMIIDEDEGDRVLRIVNMIDECLCPTYREILIKCCKAGLYGEFRRLGAGVKFLLEERYEK